MNDEHIHVFKTVASWPDGPNSTGELRQCVCGDGYESSTSYTTDKESESET